MPGKDGAPGPDPDDATLRAARYRDAQDAAGPLPADEFARPGPADVDSTVPGGELPRVRRRDETWRVAEDRLAEAIRRGDFDHLSYAGKPLPASVSSDDPDWWIKALIEREGLTDVAPEAFLLRREDARLDARLDALRSEKEVRDVLGDFNRRVIEARRQLLGGPPVVTPTRDVEREVEKWRGVHAPPPPPQAPEPPRRWWRRLAAWLWSPTR